MPTLAATPCWVIPGLSNSRRINSSALHRPAASTTAPSPPGSWKRRPSARMYSSTSTATATSSTAASTNEKTWKALRLRLTSGWLFAAVTTAFCWYHGRNIVTNRAIAATAAKRRSRSRAPQLRARPEPAGRLGWAGSWSPPPPRMRASLGTHRLYGGLQRRLAGAPSVIVPLVVAVLPARSTAVMLTE